MPDGVGNDTRVRRKIRKEFEWAAPAIELEEAWGLAVLAQHVDMTAQAIYPLASRSGTATLTAWLGRSRDANRRWVDFKLGGWRISGCLGSVQAIPGGLAAGTDATAMMYDKRPAATPVHRTWTLARVLNDTGGHTSPLSRKISRRTRGS